MATKTASAPKAATAAPVKEPPREVAAPKAGAHPPITDYTVVWVPFKNVALANNQRGYVRVLKADAAIMIAAGDAQDPYGGEPLLNIRDGNAKPPPPVVTVAITAFSAENPTVATASAGDVVKIKSGDRLKLVQTAGAALAPIAGTTATVGIRSATTFALTEIDLTAFSAVVDGVTATGTKQ